MLKVNFQTEKRKGNYVKQKESGLYKLNNRKICN